MEWILYLGLILLAAKVGAEIFQRLGMSAVVGEIAVGVLLGHSMLNLVPESDHLSHELIEHLAEMGVIFMIFLLGLETKISHILEVGATAAVVALGGLLVPLGCGFLMGELMGFSWQSSLFMGTLLMATSVAISTRVFYDCGMGRSRVTRTIVAAAVIDDVVGLIILTVVLAVTGGSSGGLGLLLTKQALLLFVAFPIALFLIPKLVSWISKMKGEGALFAVIMGAALLGAYSGVPAGMEPIIGAFLMGVIFGTTRESMAVERQAASLVHFLAPIFFVHVGLMIDVGALSQGLVLALVLTAVAAASKLVGCGGGALLRGASGKEAMVIGVGMVPRGEVGLIIAGIGSRMGLFSPEVFSAAALMCVLTIVIVPPVLKPLARTLGGETPSEPEEA